MKTSGQPFLTKERQFPNRSRIRETRHCRKEQYDLRPSNTKFKVTLHSHILPCRNFQNTSWFYEFSDPSSVTYCFKQRPQNDFIARCCSKVDRLKDSWCRKHCGMENLVGGRTCKDFIGISKLRHVKINTYFYRYT